MINLVTGIFAMLMIFVFLGYYAISIKSVPLWVIIGAILFMAALDFVKSLRREEDQEDTEQKTD